MTERDAIAGRLSEHRLIETIYHRGCSCGDWSTRSVDTFEQHLADVVMFYFPVSGDHSAERWDEGYIQAVIDLCAPDLSAGERLEWIVNHPPRRNPYSS